MKIYLLEEHTVAETRSETSLLGVFHSPKAAMGCVEWPYKWRESLAEDEKWVNSDRWGVCWWTVTRHTLNELMDMPCL